MEVRLKFKTPNFCWIGKLEHLPLILNHKLECQNAHLNSVLCNCLDGERKCAGKNLTFLIDLDSAILEYNLCNFSYVEISD